MTALRPMYCEIMENRDMRKDLDMGHHMLASDNVLIKAVLALEILQIPTNLVS